LALRHLALQAKTTIVAAIIGRCTWAEVEWPIVVEPSVTALALCAALPASTVRKIAG